jgi:hypothetical protein
LDSFLSDEKFCNYLKKNSYELLEKTHKYYGQNNDVNGRLDED